MNRVARQRLPLKNVPISRHFGITSIKFTADIESDRYTIAKPKYAEKTPDDHFEPRMYSRRSIEGNYETYKDLGKGLLSFYNALAASVGYCCSPGSFVLLDMGLMMGGVMSCAFSAAALNIGMFGTFLALYQILKISVTSVLKQLNLLMMHIWISRKHDHR